MLRVKPDGENVWQFSFSYDVLGSEAPTEEERKSGIMNKLTKLDLYEISLVPVPANQTAVVTEIKSDETEKAVKAGKRNSAKDADAIRQAISLLQGVLGEIEESDDDDEKDDSEANGAPEEQKKSNSAKESLLEYINSIKEVRS